MNTNMKIKYCTKCLFPETKPDLFFNDKGVCSACVAAEEKNSKIDALNKELSGLLNLVK